MLVRNIFREIIETREGWKTKCVTKHKQLLQYLGALRPTADKLLALSKISIAFLKFFRENPRSW